MSRSDRILLAAGGCAMVLVAVAGWILLVPSLGAPPPGIEGSLLVSSSGAPTPAASGAARADPIVVDVQGGVASPGIRELPAGSRVADAIAAAGGYGSDADLDAAASLNLAEPLADGQQVRVPRIGDAVAAAAPSAAPGAAGGAASAGGKVNLNTATPEELEALPGIGPVTVQKIVAARTERPFASLEDAVTRGAINRGQLEDILDVATAG